MPETEPKQPTAETEFFPFSPIDELNHLRELINGREVDIIPLSNVGYVVHNRKVSYMAEAPLTLLDWDDTGAQTTTDKGRCWSELEAIGIPPDIVRYCDKISRVNLGDEEPTYEPELEMRLLSEVIGRVGNGPMTLEEIKASVDALRADLTQNRNLEAHPVNLQVQDIYNRTRFTSTLYPDTIETIKTLRGNEKRPSSNVALLTYGDPSFQLAKTAQLLDSGVVNEIFLTKTRKGLYFQELLRQNPFQRLPLTYHYQETQRGVGVDFKNWWIMVTLFDDDPKQVASFNSIAEKEGINGLAVVRVRRANIKRAEQDIEIGKMVAEIRPSDTYLDTEIFKAVFDELELRGMENFLIHAVRTAGIDVLNVPDVAQVTETVAGNRNVPVDVIRDSLLEKAGFKTAGVFPTDDGDKKIWVSEQ